ncbi:hypothetical protein [Sinimarinibacterium flocculans]|uniref:hypothetical protein n=1 Tax=Sinimarinibacterium flocculans TaxID=985250 RepID=UPI0024926222|nr:hypothetical protein [Sinimarinibacterium flocculans]
MPRPSVTVALLGVGDHERRVLLAAISAVSGPALLPADLEWTKVDDAAIVVADVDHPLTAKTLEGLHQLRPREVIRFAGHLRVDVDIARPIRMQVLIQTLQGAIERALTRARADAEAAARQAAAQLSAKRTYRGVAIDAPTSPRTSGDEDSATDAAPKPKRTYRGQSY